MDNLPGFRSVLALCRQCDHPCARYGAMRAAVRAYPAAYLRLALDRPDIMRPGSEDSKALGRAAGIVSVAADAGHDFPGDAVEPWLREAAAALHGLMAADKALAARQLDELTEGQPFDGALDAAPLLRLDGAAPGKEN